MRRPSPSWAFALATAIAAIVLALPRPARAEDPPQAPNAPSPSAWPSLPPPPPPASSAALSPAPLPGPPPPAPIPPAPPSPGAPPPAPAPEPSLLPVATDPVAVADEIRDANSGLAIAATVRDLDYSEWNHGTAPGLSNPLDSEKGVLAGVDVELKIQRRVLFIPNLYVEGSVEHVGGSTSYTGYIQDNGTYVPTTTTSGSAVDDLGAKLGVGIPLGPRAALTPLLRYGFHDWKRTLGENEATPAVERYQHHELAGGFLLQGVIVPRVVLGLEATGGSTLAPNVLLTTQGIGIPLGLGTRFVFRGELTCEFRLLAHLHLFAKYVWGVFQYGQSPTSNFATVSALEPASTTIENGGRLGFSIPF